MSQKPITPLINDHDLYADPYEDDKIDPQLVVDYCEARFRVAMQAMQIATREAQIWMTKTLYRELVCEILYFSFKSLTFYSRNCASRTSESPRPSDVT
jgi:hypothetical protein